MRLTLPYPPTANHYWRYGRGRWYIAKAGKAFRDAVQAEVLALRMTGQMPREPLRGRVRLLVTVYPPDGRRRDIDNICKALLDALQHAGVYDDDRRVSRLSIKRADDPPEQPGKVVVEIT